MPEVKQEVRPLEVNYLCDACGKGMMAAVGERNADTGEVEHHCLICDHVQMFRGRPYPHIEYLDIEE